MITKKQAIELIGDLLGASDADPFAGEGARLGYREACREILEALDRAGAFPSEATALEISDVAREILDAEARGAPLTPIETARRAIRLASAARAAGMGTP